MRKLNNLLRFCTGFGLPVGLLLLIQFCLVDVAVASVSGDAYEVHFSADIRANRNVMTASIRVEQGQYNLRELNFTAPKSRYWGFKGDGQIKRQGERLIWTVPISGGELTYQFGIRQKKAGAYDANYHRRWAVLRLGDLFPAARAKALKRAVGHFDVQLQGPQSWALEGQYGDLRKLKTLIPSGRKYQRPLGWFIGGELGVRREIIEGQKVTVAAPKGAGFRRLDTLAFLRWTLPHFYRVFPPVNERLLILGAPESMWRGGLSAPGSFYLHSDLPLISENGSSVLLHELAHLSGLTNAASGDDWLAEGLAEYYSFEINRRAGGLSQTRFDAALANMSAWVRKDKGQLADPSTGADTMAAVLLFAELDRELRGAGHSLDAVTSVLLAEPMLSSATLLSAVESLLGKPSRVLSKRVVAEVD
jgi:hypothetical protein